MPSLVEIGPVVLDFKKLKFRQCLFAILFLSPIRTGQECFVPSLVEIGPMVQEKKVLDFVNVFLLFRYYLPLEKNVTFHLNKLESPSPKDLVEIGSVVLKKKIC